MSEGNVELVRALIDRWNERGEAALDAYHDDVEWDFSGWDFEVEGTWRGMEGIESVLEGLFHTHTAAFRSASVEASASQICAQLG